MEHVKHHIKHMAIAAVAILLILALAGVNFGAAARFAAVLACPVGMIAMMYMMARPKGGASSKENSTHDERVAHRH